ncbi:MAG: hypothetical protein MR503_01195 [Oscillospiraceae bacterium]|nr:hypothetical protein [Oscillospiraceae bacterium]
MKKIVMIISSMIVMLLVAFLLLQKHSFAPESYTKYDFNSEELKTISDYIDININEASIENGTFSHAKDSLFVFQISNIKLSDIESQYKMQY